MKTGTLAWLPVLLDDETLAPVDKLLLIGLADHVNERDECYVGIDRLARYAGVSYGTARRHLTALEDAGRLHRERRRRGDGNLSTYLWRLVREPARNLRAGDPLTSDQRASGRALTSARPDARAELPRDEPRIHRARTQEDRAPDALPVPADFDELRRCLRKTSPA